MIVVQAGMPTMLFSKDLQHAGHTRRFLISRAPDAGWNVRAEQDAQVLTDVRYQDWHRVERARLAFELAILALEREGWTSGGSPTAPEASP
jgi:predicted RNA methylase